MSGTKLLRCTDTAMENEKANPIVHGLPSLEESRAAMAHAVRECDEKKRDAEQRVKVILLKFGVVV